MTGREYLRGSLILLKRSPNYPTPLKEVAVQHGIKWYFALTLTFRKAAFLDVITDPPVVLHTEPKMGLMGTNYEQELSKALEEMMEKIDTFERNGSGWIVDKFLQLDLNIATYTPWYHWNVDIYVCWVKDIYIILKYYYCFYYLKVFKFLKFPCFPVPTSPILTVFNISHSLHRLVPPTLVSLFLELLALAPPANNAF